MNDEYQKQVVNNIQQLGSCTDLQKDSISWIKRTARLGYSYNFNCLGRPIIQYPQDMIAMQELIWQIKPDLIIETGIAHGGSLVLSASMLALLDMTDAIDAGVTIDPKQSQRKVLGIDIDIRAHNREAIEAHPMASRIQMIQGSSIAPEIIEQVKQIAKDYKRILVCLDSNHT
ncbi:MAG: CmcI family methyltransferase, partial [Methylococcales bacterium]|nr:CmcI family methyltransferase [Methylococcales bacterium]